MSLLASSILLVAAAQVLPPGFGAKPVTIRGMVAQGVECPVVRADDGTLYSLVPVDRAQPLMGRRVKVVGQPQGMSTCMQGLPLEIISIEAE